MQDSIRRAELLVQAGDIPGAISVYSKYLDQFPDDANTLNRTADLLVRVNKNKNAIKCFKEVAKQFKRDGFLVKSMAVYKKIIRLDPTHLDVYENLAELYREAGLLAEAVEQYRVLAQYYRKRGEINKAKGLEYRVQQLTSGQAKEDVVTNDSDTLGLPSPAAGLPVDGVPIVQAPVDMTVFLCHASEDKPAVRQLYTRLRQELLQPWMDEEDLLPGQNWEREIERAVRRSHAVAICLSRRATTKAGYVHKEIRFALDVLEQQPEGIIFIIPIRLEECEIPTVLRPLHYVDLFKPRGYERLLCALDSRARQLGFR
jgi:tetratricopeptide (TPR) repeat protein